MINQDLYRELKSLSKEYPVQTEWLCQYDKECGAYLIRELCHEELNRLHNPDGNATFIISIQMMNWLRYLSRMEPCAKYQTPYLWSPVYKVIEFFYDKDYNLKDEFKDLQKLYTLVRKGVRLWFKHLQQLI